MDSNLYPFERIQRYVALTCDTLKIIQIKKPFKSNDLKGSYLWSGQLDKFRTC
jgi:hypothetical protein